MDFSNIHVMCLHVILYDTGILFCASARHLEMVMLKTRPMLVYSLIQWKSLHHNIHSCMTKLMLVYSLTWNTTLVSTFTHV